MADAFVGLSLQTTEIPDKGALMLATTAIETAMRHPPPPLG